MAQAAIRFMHHGQLDGNVLECSIVSEGRNGHSSGKGIGAKHENSFLRSQTRDRHQSGHHSYSRDGLPTRARN